MATPIKRWHRVRTADGTEATVRYVDPRDGMAEIYTADETTLTLPVSELRRIPGRTLPTITGLPTERPHCPMCARALQPEVDETRETGKPYGTARVLTRTFTGWKGYAIERGNSFDKFCTLRCARDFANAAYRAGYRITRKDKG